MLSFLAGCFRPAPPLEEGDAKDSNITTESATDGSVTTQGHPVVLKRLPAKSPSPKITFTPTATLPATNYTPDSSPDTTSASSTLSLNAGNVGGIKPTLTGHCDSTAMSHTAISSSGRVQSVTCAGDGSLSVVVQLPAGSSSFAITVQSNYSGGSNQRTTSTYTRTPFVCPSGYVGVPGSGIPGLGNVNASRGNASWWLDVDRDFCVMKYPAKNNNGSTYASSTMSGLPWTNIKRGTDELTAASAFKACNDVPGGTFRLISNSQWQTVGRNIEITDTNWSGGAVGIGTLPLGQEQFLSTTESVFDFGGNVQQWVSDDSSSLGLNPLIGSGYQEFNAGVFPTSGTNGGVNRLIFASLGNFTSADGVGQIYGGSGAVRRGGAGQDSSFAGPFWAALNYSSNNSAPEVGFRCVYLPQ